MRIFNDQKTYEILNPDLTKGRLIEDRLLLKTLPAVEYVEEQGHFETIAEYPNGGKDVKWIVDAPAIFAKDAEDVYEEIQIYVPFTAEEIDKQNKSRIEEQITYLKQQLTPLNEKLLQDAAGEEVPSLEFFKEEFRRVHGEIRRLQEKEPRAVKPSLEQSEVPEGEITQGD